MSKEAPIPMTAAARAVVVPGEMTGEQLDAARKAWSKLPYNAAAAVIFNEVYKAFLSAAPSSPDAQVGQEWIPVTERLPEDGGDYLTIADGVPMICEFFNITKNWDTDAESTACPTVTHWMPLPRLSGEMK